MTTSRISVIVAAIILFGAVISAWGQQNEPSAGGEIFEKVQSEFAQAYNRKGCRCHGGIF